MRKLKPPTKKAGGPSAPRKFVGGKPVVEPQKKSGPKKRLARDSDRDYAFRMATAFDEWRKHARSSLFDKGVFNDPVRLVEKFDEAVAEGAHLSYLLRQFATHGTWEVPLEAASLRHVLGRRYVELRREGIAHDAAIDRCVTEFECDRRTVATAASKALPGYTLRTFRTADGRLILAIEGPPRKPDK